MPVSGFVNNYYCALPVCFIWRKSYDWGFVFAVCSLSSKEVFSYIIQSTGAHSTSSGWITIAVRPATGLLVDEQENRRVSISFTIYGKCSHIRAYLFFFLFFLLVTVYLLWSLHHILINISQALLYFFLSACISWYVSMIAWCLDDNENKRY